MHAKKCNHNFESGRSEVGLEKNEFLALSVLQRRSVFQVTDTFKISIFCSHQNVKLKIVVFFLRTQPVIELIPTYN